MGLKNITHIGIMIFLVIAVQFITKWTDTSFYLTQLTMSAYYSIVVIGLCLVMGYAGQISLGHAGFFAIGKKPLTVIFMWRSCSID